MSDKDTTSSQGQLREALDSLAIRKEYPKIGFVILLALYVAASVGVTTSARGAGGVLMLFDNPIPLQAFAGVFTSLANFCLIILVVLYRKPGFIVALVILMLQFPLVLNGLIFEHNFGNLPGLFINVFTIAVTTLIYVSLRQNDRFQANLREQALMDSMTKLPNRVACSELINQLVERGDKFAVVSVDLNNFKSINDTMGQSAGDQVLIAVASRLKAASDSGQSKTLDFVAYQGGDEFTFIIRDYDSEDNIMRTLEFYESVFEEKLTIDDCDYVITASFGYAEFPTDASNSDSLLTYADVAMYEAKRHKAGKRIWHFTPDLLDAERTLEVERMIRGALESGSLYFLLQPQFDISHKLRGFEALARMKDANGNIVSPAEFIPVAEKVGLIDRIDAVIFRDSAEFLGELIKRTDTDITLSVNVSVKHLMRNDFIEEVQGILDTTGVPANQIEIEITESVMIDSMEKALHCINDLKEMGVKVAIDDFGTGYSSLSYLSNFPVDLLKVDKSFIDVMNSGDSSKRYVAAIISIGHIMDFDVIAEGVEESDQLETLRSIGCDYIQGFFWGQPMPSEDAEQLVLQAMQN